MTYNFDTLITDRTQADTDRVRELMGKYLAGTITPEEKAEFIQPMKGAYNAADLNRVGHAVAYLADVLGRYGYAVQVSVRTDWTDRDIPTQTQLQQYLANVAAIRAAMAMLPSTPGVPADMESLTAAKANAIEQILADCEVLVKSIPAVSLRAGQPMFFCGFAIYMDFTRLLADSGGTLIETADGYYIAVHD